MKKTPKLRFPEFSGEWNHRKLNEIIERVVRKNKGNISTLPLTISAQYGLVNQENFFNKTVASKNLEGYYLLKNGEFAYNKSYSNGYPWGAIKRLDKYDMGVLSSLYICFRNINGISSEYLTHYFETTKWYKEISMIAVEGARNHGLLNISVSDFFETLHYIPDYIEQNKIAKFLDIIDKKIEKQQEKVEALEAYKKGIMQKIFSKEIRFKDEKGEDFPEWQEKRMGELCSISTGKKDTQDKVENGKYPFFVRSQNEERINSYSFDGEAILTAGDGVGVGRVFHYINGKFDFHQRVYKLSDFTCDTYGRYIYEYFRINFIREVTKYTAKTSVDSVRMEMISGMKIPCPVFEEQKKIADFLNKIDNKVAIEEQKLDQLKEWKKGLLQQMFV